MRPASRHRTLIARLGTAGFLFFLAKGLSWLALPAWLYATR